MTTNTPVTIARRALLVAPIVAIPIAFFAAIPWLKQQDQTVALAIAGATAILVMGYSAVLAARATRRLDEVELAGQRFAQAQGWTIGIIAGGLVLVFPPAMNALTELANGLAGAMGDGSPEVAVRTAIVIGFMMVIILQTLGMVAASIWWGRRLGSQA